MLVLQLVILQAFVSVYIYTLDPENFDREKYIYVRRFETCYVVIRTRIHRVLAFRPTYIIDIIIYANFRGFSR